MANTVRTYISDGSRVLYPIDFELGYLREEYVFVYTGDDYSTQLPYTWQNPSEIELDVAIPLGEVLTIRRIVPRHNLINSYTNGANLHKKELNDSYLQSLMILEEIADGYISVDSVITLVGGAAIKGDLDMLDNQIKNLKAAVEPNDAVNLQQVSELLFANGIDGVVPVVAPKQLGDGVLTTFYTPATGTSNVSASSFLVHVAGVYYRPQTDFVIDQTTGNITFVVNSVPTAPVIGAEIDITYYNPIAIESLDTALVTATGTTTPRRLADRFADEIDVRDFLAIDITGVSDSTSGMQSAIDLAASTGRKINGTGVIACSQLEWKSNVNFEGSGFSTCELRQIAGSNKDFIITNGTIDSFSIKNCAVNGNYFISAWNAATGVLGNTTGDGIVIDGYAGVIDIVLYNIAGTGLYCKDLTTPPPSSTTRQLMDISVIGQDFGKEGIVIKGPNDWLLRKAWIGRAGILPRPNADTMVSSSDKYPADTDSPCSGIVIDVANIEIGDVHVFACWSGCGFKTYGTCRLTKGGRIISESNNSQVQLSQGTYGSGFFDIRNVALFHPNWSAATPSYTSPDPRWDCITVDAETFTGECTMKRTVTALSRVVGTTGLVLNGSAKMNFTFSNSGAPVGDPDNGHDYSGTVAQITGRGGVLNCLATRAYGNTVEITSEGATIDVNATLCKNGAVVHRDSVGNSMRGNRITGSLANCSLGFESVGTPSSEVISLSMELNTAEVPFTGDKMDYSKGQVWDISASVNNANFSTRRFLQEALDVSTTGDKTVTVTHEFLWLPDQREVQISVDDRSSVSTARLDYIRVGNIDATNITIVYGVGTADVSGAANLRVNVRVG